MTIVLYTFFDLDHHGKFTQLYSFLNLQISLLVILMHITNTRRQQPWPVQQKH